MTYYKTTFIAILFFTWILTPLLTNAQDGLPDASFGIEGRVITPIRAGYDSGYGVAIQADGKIVVAGESQKGNSDSDYDVALVRYHPDGTLDQGFGNGGKGNYIYGHHLGPEWLGAATTRWEDRGRRTNPQRCYLRLFLAIRYLPNGSLDPSFSNNGKVKIPVGSSHDFGWFCALQPNGKIIVTGPVRQGSDLEFGVVRLKANGTLDGGFGNGGKVITPLTNADDFSWSCVVQPDGKIVVGGAATSSNLRDFAVVRLFAEWIA